MKSFDYAIIGAGPTGSYLAKRLADKGFNVGLFDKKKKVGIPIQCTGLLTKEISRYCKIIPDFLANETNKIRLFSKNDSIEIKSPEYVVDREKFDNHLLQSAKNARAKISLGNAFLGEKNGRIILEKGSIKANAIIGCDGPNSSVNSHFGIIKSRKYFLGKQFILKGKFNDSFYSAYFEEKFRDFFAWVVPESKSIARVGIASKDIKSVTSKLDYFMKSRKISGKIIGVNAGLIPLFNPFDSNYKKINGLNAYLFGDAAGHVKATTGGGIIPSFKAIDESMGQICNLKKPLLLDSKKELLFHLLAHKMMERYNDKDYDSLLQILGSKASKKILSEINRDNFSKMAFKLMLKNPKILGAIKLF